MDTNTPTSAREDASGASASGQPIETLLTGAALLGVPRLNKGSAFPDDERTAFGLHGLLPPGVMTIEQQLVRTYDSFRAKASDLERYIYLASLQDRNEVLFFRLLQAHIAEMSPIIYTPVVGLACQNFSHIYRRPHGLYISYVRRDDIERILRASPAPDPRVIVVTDGERILGLGDLGVGGMLIPIGKLALYTICAGISPSMTLPIILDTGTDNEQLRADPLYLGWRHARVRGAEYDAFVDAFVAAVRRVYPDAVLQWEDFARDNARRLLERYQDQLCTFNDDIQGTAAVTLAGLLAATDATGVPLREQRVVMLGAGSAATGVADLLVMAMVEDGATEEEARRRVWLVDSHGLVHTGRTDLSQEKARFAQPVWTPAGDGAQALDLFEVVRHARPTILIGTAARRGAFTEAVVREMARHIERPVIFPLSNPTEKSEATPDDLLRWTDGRALVATGSPFPDVERDGRAIRIGQCNNMFIFPGVGLGVLASRARRVTNSMFLAAARALSAVAPSRGDPQAPLYPYIENVRVASRAVALAVAIEAMRAGVADPLDPQTLEQQVDAMMWEPRYRSLVRRRE
ncbi:MAG TPA: NAD-dependent malic enzyme [Ktedonobacterales bacterium]|nr:NAD-dependent malic enzyme [Ktedonobacterales bacterium]